MSATEVHRGSLDLQTSDLDSLLPWYLANRRVLPWRATSDPYRIWISEVMLQQTGVSTVVPYFERWMARFPTVQALAAADEQEVLSIWQGLGYYRRCRNLLAGARRIGELGWPLNAEGWRKVPGVGRYTAAAIASIAFGEPVPVVDGNVERVYARFTADSASGSELTRRAWAWAEREVRVDTPGDWNQALMELGATICTPTRPVCDVCPIASTCAAKETGEVDALPRVTPKLAVVRLEFDVEVGVFGGRFGLRQIAAGQWWEGMWEFPRHSKGGITAEGERLKPIKHTVTHHRITLFPVLIRLINATPGLTWFSQEDLRTLPLPAPQRKLVTALLSHAPS